MRAKTPKIKIEFGKPPPKIQRVREVTDKDIEENALELHAQGLTPYYASQIAVGKAKRLSTQKAKVYGSRDSERACGNGANRVSLVGTIAKRLQRKPR